MDNQYGENICKKLVKDVWFTTDNIDIFFNTVTIDFTINFVDENDYYYESWTVM